MTQASASSSKALTGRERLIVALDVPTADDARRAVGELAGHVGAFKIGLQLFTATGPAFVREVCGAGHKVFLDLKFHDIPNTVAMAGVEAARLGVWMFNVHAAAGGEMLRRLVEEVGNACAKEAIDRPRMIAVTVLTSSDANTLAETGIVGGVEDQVRRLAVLTAASGMDGVVASPRECIAIRKAVSNSSFLIVTPGIRSINATADDQKRINNAGSALRAGADYLVVGRPIMDAADRLRAVERLVEEIDNETR